MVKPTKMSAKSSGKRNSFEKLLDGDLDLAFCVVSVFGILDFIKELLF